MKNSEARQAEVNRIFRTESILTHGIAALLGYQWKRSCAVSSLFLFLVFIFASLFVRRGSCKYTHLSRYGQVPADINVRHGSCLKLRDMLHDMLHKVRGGALLYSALCVIAVT